MNLSEITKYIINLFESDSLVNTIALSDNDIIDTKKESIYPLVTISFNGSELSEDNLLKYDFTISVLQQRDATRKMKPSKLMEKTNWIDNMNECNSICTNFINYIRRIEVNNNIDIDSLSILEPLNHFGGADLDGFRFDITLSTPNAGSCYPDAYVNIPDNIIPFPDFELLSNKSDVYTVDLDKYYTANYINNLPSPTPTPDATTTVKGKLKIAGDLSGTADLPTVPGLSILQNEIDNLTKSDVGLPNVDNTSDATKNVLSATKLTTSRNINGVAFDGTANITIIDSTKEPTINGTSLSDFWSGAKTFRNLATDVRAVLLTGLSTATNSVISATDSILIALGKLQAQLNDITNVYATKSMSAFKIRVNNTNATANATEADYKAPRKQTYAGTITWSGTTAPSGTINQTYNWHQIDNLVTLEISVLYSVPGSGVSIVTFTLPPDCPTPIRPDGFTGALNTLYGGIGYAHTAANQVPTVLSRTILRSNAANTGYEVTAVGSSGGHIMAVVQIQYMTA